MKKLEVGQKIEIVELLTDTPNGLNYNVFTKGSQRPFYPCENGVYGSGYVQANDGVYEYMSQTMGEIKPIGKLIIKYLKHI